MVREPVDALAEKLPSARGLTAEILARMGLHTRDRQQLWYEPFAVCDGA